MAGMLILRRRIRAVKNIQQVTKAMEMVAAAKLRRAQERVVAARPYARQLQAVLGRLVAEQAEISHPLLQAREVKKRAVMIITGDRGLCGSYNANVIRRTQGLTEGKRDSLISVGRKGRDFFRRRGYQVMREYVAMGEDPGFGQARTIARYLMDIYCRGEVDEVRVVYTEFVSALTQRPSELVLLPVRPPRAGEDRGEGLPDYIYEPSPAAVFDVLLPRYVEVVVFQCLLESKASEHGARMTAMGNATDNAEEMIEELTLEYNRERQASITREISEIVRGAEALK